MSQPTIGIVGNGVVGYATGHSFKEYASVKTYDTRPELCTHDFDEVVRCDYVFVCLPTPRLPDGRCDTSALDDFFFNHDLQDEPLFVIKSTVPLHYTERINERLSRTPLGLVRVVHNPEFLTARCANVEAQLPTRQIIGIPPGSSDLVANGLIGLYKRRFPGAQLFVMPSTASESLKLGTNSLFAVLVWFWNEFKIICDKNGIDFQQVMEALLSDGRIPCNHTRVPGPDGMLGFGGACLPKDLASFATHAETDIFKRICERNLAIRSGVGAVTQGA